MNLAVTIIVVLLRKIFKWNSVWEQEFQIEENCNW